MSISKFLKKIIFFLLVLFYLLSTYSNCLAIPGTCIDTNYYYLYDYNINNFGSFPNFENAISVAKNDDRVLSGDYYYFVYTLNRNSDDNNYRYLFFRKKFVF